MGIAETFESLQAALNRPQPPEWTEVCGLLDLPDERWREHDPAHAIAALRSEWCRLNTDWSGVGVLWIGTAQDDDGALLHLVGYATLDENGFPQGGPNTWGGVLRADDLTALRGYATHETMPDPYGYWAVLAWSGLTARLMDIAPAGVQTLVGFSGGDWLVIEAA